jgi:hypothetical protein
MYFIPRARRGEGAGNGSRKTGDEEQKGGEQERGSNKNLLVKKEGCVLYFL